MTLQEHNEANAKKQKAGKGFRQITVLLPVKLFAAIDKAAVREHRFRSQQVIVLLERGLQ
jgi:hypothetical protein